MPTTKTKRARKPAARSRRRTPVAGEVELRPLLAQMDPPQEPEQPSPVASYARGPMDPDSDDDPLPEPLPEPMSDPMPGPQHAIMGCANCSHIPFGANSMIALMAAIVFTLSSLVVASSIVIDLQSSQIRALNTGDVNVVARR